MGTSIPIAVRGSTGVSLALGPPTYGNLEEFSNIPTKSCRVILFSPDGKYFTCVFGSTIKITRTDTWEDVATIEGVKAYFLSFSPKSTYLMSWEPFEITKTNPEGSPNLNIYNTKNGELVKNFIHKSQTNWEPQWSLDEKLFSRIVNTDIVFYEDCNFENIVHRLNSCKIASYSISPIDGTYYVICHSPGTKGQPSLARLFKYPNLDTQQALANKSFFQADKVEYFWNLKGLHCLLLTSTEQDKSGKSYYGKQGLHFTGTNGQTNLVALSKEGSIYSVTWSPKSHEFCVVYGFMPAKATIFNIKCEPVFELGTGPKNVAHYNPHGTMLLLGGFGNLRGTVEIWDMNNKKIVGKCDASDTTLLEWCPDGTYFLTATTAPRLRIGNGYKIWHYSGALLYEKSWNEDELHELTWQKFPKNSFKEPQISSEKIVSIASTKVEASTQAYRPPSARNRPGPAVSFKLDDDDEGVHKPGELATTKAALKQRKKRQAKAAAKRAEGYQPPSPVNAAPAVSAADKLHAVLTGDADKDKKIKNLMKKIHAIEKLKAELASGKTLETNQLSKIEGEKDILKEIEQLQI